MKKKIVLFFSVLFFLVSSAFCLISSLVPFNIVSEDLSALLGLIMIIASVLFLFYAGIVKR